MPAQLLCKARDRSDVLRPIGLRRISGGASVSPPERIESDRFFGEMVGADEEVGAARERMIVALLSATRTGAKMVGPSGARKIRSKGLP